MDNGFDQLSNLPTDVTQKILSFLPIKEVVRTSILSSEWRYKWAMLPDFVINEPGFPVVLYNHDKLVKIVDHLLFLHIGPIGKVKFSHRNLEGSADINRWILHLSRNSIKEFAFMFWKTPLYKMPSCLFSCQDLVHLNLFNCLLKPPCTFKGFNSLKRLEFQRVTLTQDDFENLVVRSPLLDLLTIIDCRGFTKLKIDAPNLRVFALTKSDREALSLHNTLKLTSILICLTANGDQRRQVPGSSSNLLGFFGQCPHVQVAYILRYCLKYLAVGDLPLQLPSPCLPALTRLSIDINFNDLKEVSTALYILRSSPALQNLLIQVHQDGQVVVREENPWLDDNQNFILGKLQIVELTDVTSAKAVLDFMKILLLNSPVLEKVLVKRAPSFSRRISPNGSSEILTRLVQFRRSSALAEIVYQDTT